MRCACVIIYLHSTVFLTGPRYGVVVFGGDHFFHSSGFPEVKRRLAFVLSE